MLIFALTRDVLVLSEKYIHRLICKFWVFTPIFNLDHALQIKYVGRDLTKSEQTRTIAFRAIDEKRAPASGRFFFHVFDPIKVPRHPESLTLNDTRFWGVRGLPRVGYVFMCQELFEQYRAEFTHLEKKYVGKRNEELVKKKEGDIKTPLPNPKHDSCHTCNGRFENYREHIVSEQHRQRVLEDTLYGEIDSVIDELDDAKKIKASTKTRKSVKRREITMQDFSLKLSFFVQNQTNQPSELFPTLGPSTGTNTRTDEIVKKQPLFAFAPTQVIGKMRRPHKEES